MKLISGQEYLARYPNFKLVNRQNDIARIMSILTRKKNNSLLLTGTRGVGVSSLIRGLLSFKNDDNASFDILSKQFFVLDIDGLYASGDNQEINKEFQQIIHSLGKTPNAVLVILDAYAFIEGAKNSGNDHFINVLNQADKSDKFQTIIEVNDDQLNAVYSWNNCVSDLYTLYEVKELSGHELYDVVREVATTDLESFHNIKISDEAIKEAIYLTNKYREEFGLGKCQPTKAISLLDRALSKYKQNVSEDHPLLAKLRKDIAEADDEALKEELQEVYNSSFADWMEKKLEIQKLAKAQTEAEALRLKYEDELGKAKEKQEKGEVECDAISKREIANFKALAKAGFDSKEVCELKKNIKDINSEIERMSMQYKTVTQALNANLKLDKDEVIESFGIISGISSAKLNENEIETLKNLENNLLNDVYGQDEIVTKIANAIKVAKVDTMKDPGPAASFLFLGPSGTGKTWLSKSLAKHMFGDEKSLIRFDMSEYMEKHAVAKLIGAPPGYEGFECGGILTNTVRKNPVGIYLFDEIEKAHPDVFNIFLQILSDGRLTDNIGRTVDFSETIIIMTSNIGQKYYLDASLSNEEAINLANKELSETYRSELLNRFNGRENIFHFNRLEMSTIEKIVKREINNLDLNYARQGIHVNIDDQSISAFCKDHYDVIRGARGLPGYIKATLRPVIVNYLLNCPGIMGIFDVKYDTDEKGFVINFIVGTKEND